MLEWFLTVVHFTVRCIDTAVESGDEEAWGRSGRWDSGCRRRWGGGTVGVGCGGEDDAPRGTV